MWSIPSRLGGNWLGPLECGPAASSAAGPCAAQEAPSACGYLPEGTRRWTGASGLSCSGKTDGWTDQALPAGRWLGWEIPGASLSPGADPAVPSEQQGDRQTDGAGEGQGLWEWGCSVSLFLNNAFIYYWLLWVSVAGHGPRSGGGAFSWRHLLLRSAESEVWGLR